jgi:signal transduction histidine kinase
MPIGPMPGYIDSVKMNSSKIAEKTIGLARLIFIGLVLLISLQNNSVFAQEDYYEPDLELLINNKGGETLESILNNPEEFVFQKAEELGRTTFSQNKEYWFRFEIQPMQTVQNVNLLRVLPATLDSVEIYFPKGNGEFELQKAGDLTPYSLWRIPYRASAFAFFIQDNKEFAYLKLQTKNRANLNVSLFTPYSFFLTAVTEFVVFGAYWGVLSTIILVNILQGIWFKDAAYKFYIFHLAAILLWVSTVEGYVNQLPFSSPILTNTMSEVSSYTLILTAILWYRNVIISRKTRNRFENTVYYSLVSLLSAGILLSIFRIDLEIGPLFVYVISLSMLCGFFYFTVGLTSYLKNRAQYSIDHVVVISASLLSLALLTAHGMNFIFGLVDHTHAVLFFEASQLLVISLSQIAISIRMGVIRRSENYEKAKKELAIENIEKEKTISNMQARFLSIIYHEIRTPLSVIRLALAMKDPSESVKKYAKQAITNIDRIIERCSYADALYNSKIIPILEPCDLALTIEKLVDENYINAPIDIIDNLRDHEIQSDSELLKIILNNLIGNAVKYCSYGSRVSIELRSNLVGETAGKYFIIRNKLDHPEEVDREGIFERYIRTPSAEKVSGSGLGLFIVKGLLESLYAEITCEINKNEIEFKVCF